MQTVLPNPVDFATRGYGDLGAIPRFDRDYCVGPDFLGDPVAAYVRYSTRWCAFVSPSGVRVGKLVPGFTAAESDGVLTGLYDTPGFSTTHLGAAFDKNGYPFLTRQLTPTTWEARKFELGVPRVFGPFDGITPLPWLSALAVNDAIDQEVVVFYVKTGGTVLYCRHESEEFLIEHAVSSALPAPLGRLTKLDYDVPSLRLLIWGLSLSATRPGTQQVLLRSKQYSDYPVWVHSDAMVGGVGIAGVYAPLVVTLPGQTDLTLSGEVSLEGAYTEVVKEASEVDASALSHSLGVEGTYDEMVLVASEADPSTLDEDLELSGVYTDIVRPTGTVTDSMDVGLALSGAYTAV